MPPKGHRPARGRGSVRGGGRGQGRGRGAPVAESPSTALPQVNETDSQSTLVDSEMPDVEPAAHTTPVHELEQTDPNFSPATQPTETPAPTPVRPPPSISHTNGAVASGSGTRGNGASRASKFKPKIVRAGAKEREEREAREREKENARLGAVAAAAAKESRVWGRGRGGRGRGDAMGRGRGVRTGGTASGPFAVAPPGGDKRGFVSGGGGGAVKREPGSVNSRGPGDSGSGSSAKVEGGASGRAFAGSHYPVAGPYMPEPQYPDEDDDAPRVDIELINLASDDEDEVIITGVGRVNKGKAVATNNLRPIRLDRKEHKERITIVNTDTTIKAPPEEEDLDVMLVDEDRSSKAIPHQREWKGTYPDDVQIKTEPGIVPEITYGRMAPSSPPPADFKVPVEVGANDPEIEMELNAPKPEPISPTAQRPKPRRASKKKERMPVIHTDEDRAEWERHLEDMEVLRGELVGLAIPQNHSRDTEGDVDMDVQEQALEKEDGRIYLFQFPPVLPKLFDETTNSNPNIKDNEVELVVSHDLTNDPKVEIKTEEKAVEIKQEEVDADEEAKRKESEALVIEEGLIGRLVVRQSGRVELIWGGTNMKISRGMETSFFSAGTVVDGMDRWVQGEKAKDLEAMRSIRGMTHAMGEIMGKFVVTPDWTNIH